MHALPGYYRVSEFTFTLQADNAVNALDVIMPEPFAQIHHPHLQVSVDGGSTIPTPLHRCRRHTLSILSPGMFASSSACATNLIFNH